MRVIQSFWPSNETVKEPNNTTSLQLSSEVPPIIFIFMAAVLCWVTPRLGGEDAIASECFDTWTWRSCVSSILFSQPPAHLLQYTLCVLCWPLLDSLWPPYFQQRRCKPSPSCWLHLSVSFVGNRIHTVLQSVKRERLRGGHTAVIWLYLHIWLFWYCNFNCVTESVDRETNHLFPIQSCLLSFVALCLMLGGRDDSANRTSSIKCIFMTSQFELELYLTEVKLQSPDVPLSHLDLLPKWEQNWTQNKYNYKDVCSYVEVIDVILFTFK